MMFNNADLWYETRRSMYMPSRSCNRLPASQGEHEGGVGLVPWSDGPGDRRNRFHGKGPTEAGPEWGVPRWWSRQRCEIAPSTHTEEMNITDRPCHGWGGYSPNPHCWGLGSTHASLCEIYARQSDSWDKSTSEYFRFPLPVSFH